VTGPAIVYSKTVSVPSKAFPGIKRRKLAINDIGEGDDGFTRIPFELRDGDVIQVIRGNDVTTTSELPLVIPPLPKGDMKDLKTWKEYWKQHDAAIRNTTLDEMIKLTKMIEEDETERWQQLGRPKNDGYINGSHSGYGHALRDMRQWIDNIKRAHEIHNQKEAP
jgi:hypothetical protein